jgi:hypothetical protein
MIRICPIEEFPCDHCEADRLLDRLVVVGRYLLLQQEGKEETGLGVQTGEFEKLLAMLQRGRKVFLLVRCIREAERRHLAQVHRVGWRSSNWISGQI